VANPPVNRNAFDGHAIADVLLTVIGQFSTTLVR